MAEKKEWKVGDEVEVQMKGTIDQIELETDYFSQGKERKPMYRVKSQVSGDTAWVYEDKIVPLPEERQL